MSAESEAGVSMNGMDGDLLAIETRAGDDEAERQTLAPEKAAGRRAGAKEEMKAMVRGRRG